ncbi:MAG: ferritin [ANME-2 cluster archaeon]|nr:ferritin [ANME-2 cluster archaeon]MBC2702511.1 ferritin [ANME-2 cluster archaeon]MBC2706555.1 ferritin [ANME-2 cluster archaeon]MBC2747055.1 ferritin [ANME-2 cluster archaeon]MBC2762781.1 ferritin [ANME-2 cluster archaeon]
MTDALNNQLNKEIYSVYLYMSMSAYSSYSRLKVFVNWFMVQYQEEMTHAMKIYDYFYSQGQQIKLIAINQPPTEFESPLDMFEKTLKHEQFVTKSINDLVDLMVFVPIGAATMLLRKRT